MESWVMLSLFSGYGLLLGASWTVFSTIPSEAEDFYDVGEVAVSMFTLALTIGFVVTFIPASWLLARSLQRTLQGAVLLMSVGAVLRWAVRSNYALALLGQCLIALGNAVFLSGGAALAEFWFPQHRVLLATAIANLSGNVGGGVQMLVSSLLKDVPLLLGIQAILALIEAALVCLFFKPDPLHRDTSVAWGDLKEYSRNRKAVCFVLLSGATAGSVFAFIGLLYIVLDPAGYTSLQTGFIGFTLSLSGMFGGVCSNFIFANSRFSTLTLQLYLLCGIICSVVLCAAVLSFPAMLVVCAFYGFSALGFVPQAIRLAVEDGSTVHPSVPTSMFFLTSQVVALVQSLLALGFQWLTDLTALYILALFTTLTMAFFLVLFRMDLAADSAAQPLKEDQDILAKEN